MEPRIQYAKTSDGVSIAYYVLGQGSPLLVAWAFPSHLQLDWDIPAIRSGIEAAAQRYKLIRYDPRGCGMSDRDVDDFSLDAMVRDMEAVTGVLNIESAAIVSRMLHTPVAIAFASRHPNRVSRLALVGAFARGQDLWSEHLEVMVKAAETDWEFAVKGAVAANIGWSQPELAGEIVAYTMASIDARTFGSFYRQWRQWDVSDLLSSVSMPTLVLQEHHRNAPADVSRKLAASLPDARLVILPEGPATRGASYQSAMIATDEFLREGQERGAPSSPARHQPEAARRDRREELSGITAILFADIVDSTALTEQMGDAAFRAKARELGPSLRSVIRECAGTPVEGPTLGDGVLAVFTSAREAIQAGLRCAGAAQALGLSLHVGLHAGDVTREKDPDGRDNVYGGAVNVAARISGLSAAGEVLVSETVRSLARTSAGVRFEDRGEQALKGVGEAVRVWAVVSESGSE